MKKIFFIFSFIISVYSFGQLPREFPKKLINKVFCGKASTTGKSLSGYTNFLDFPYRLTISEDGIFAEFNPREKFKENGWGRTQTITNFVEWKREPAYDKYNDLYGHTIYYKIYSGKEKYSISEISIWVPTDKSLDNQISVSVWVAAYDPTTLRANENLICETLKSKEEIKKEEKERASLDMARRKKSDLELPLVLNKLDKLLISKDTLSIISALLELENSDLINGNENELNHSKLEVFNNIKRKYDEKIRLTEKEKEKERVRLENELIEKERVRLERVRLEKERILSYTTNTIIIKKLEITTQDFPKTMSWSDATLACSELGNGWRLPTKNELRLMYSKKNKIGGFANVDYWSSTETPNSNGHAWFQNFNMGSQSVELKKDLNLVRAVRAF